MTVLGSLVVVVVLIGALIVVPRGRRAAVAVPLVVFLVLALVAAMAGRNRLGDQALPHPAATFTNHCRLALQFAQSGLYDATATELEAAFRATAKDSPKIDGAKADCNAAAELFRTHANGQQGSGAAASTGAAGEPTGDETAIVTVIQVGAERAATGFLNRAIGGTDSAQAVSLSLGAFGWVLLARPLLGRGVLGARGVFRLPPRG